MPRRLVLAGGAFSGSLRALLPHPPNWSGFMRSRFPAGTVERARRTWLERLHSEYRSAQILQRFAAEVQGAGDPFDAWVWATDLVTDELRHVELCRQACEALGTEPTLPTPVEEALSEPFLAAPMAQRALNTALGMLAVSETLSVGFIRDLAERCDTPGIADVLRLTIEDEAEHGDLGWAYVEASLARFPKSTLSAWRSLVSQVLAPHRQRATAALEGVAPEDRQLDRHPDNGWIELGLFSPARQALVFERTLDAELRPRLEALGLWEA